MSTLTLTVLGCGSSSGTPVINCDCETCLSGLPENQRSRCAAWLQSDDGASIVIDTGTDFRTQALRERISHVDAVLYTHPHADHLNGIDDLRAFCYQQKAAIPVYGNGFTLANIQSRFDYAFLEPRDFWDKPVLKAHCLQAAQTIAGLPVQAFTVPHGRWSVSAFRIGNIAWLTDLNDISDEVIAQLQGLDYLFLDCLMEHDYPSHLSVERAFAFAQCIAAKQTYLIHMTHRLGYHELQARCPAGIAVAYDGLSVTSGL